MSNETVLDDADTTMTDTRESVFDNIQGTRDALTVKRVFGDSYEVDGLTIIPVARVAGGAGGGGGEGHDEDHRNQGRGFGSGFGIGANPVGVYEIRDGQAVWKPAIDINRVVHGGQLLAGVIAVCTAAVIWRRS